MRRLACSDCGFESHGGHECFECSVLSGTGLGDEPITRPEQSCRLWCVVVCDLETSRITRPWTTAGCRAKRQKECREGIGASAGAMVIDGVRCRHCAGI